MIGSINEQKVGYVSCDFKVYGGSFGTHNSKRLFQFIDYLTKNKIPLIFSFNTIGVRISEGRKVFPQAFRLIPALKTFAESNFLITTVNGRCLGLGCLLFGLGDYRVAYSPDATLNLTGPEVFKLFFGEKVSFDAAACSVRHFNKSHIIQEIFPNKEIMHSKIKSLVALNTKDIFNTNLLVDNEPSPIPTKALNKAQHDLKNIH